MSQWISRLGVSLLLTAAAAANGYAQCAAQPSDVEQYTFVTLENCGYVFGGDATPAFNAALATGADVIVLKSVYVFSSAPNPIRRPLWLKGMRAGRTEIKRDFVLPAGSVDGVINFRAGADSGVKITDVTFTTGARTAGAGCLLSIQNDGVYAPGLVELMHITMTPGLGAGYEYGLCIGALPGAGVYGVRTVDISNTTIWGGRIGAALFNGVVSLSWNGGSTWSAGGGSGKITLTGAADRYNYYVILNMPSIDAFECDFCAGVNVRTTTIGGVVITSNSFGVYGEGGIPPSARFEINGHYSCWDKQGYGPRVCGP